MQRSVRDTPLSLSLYAFAFLLPFEGILGRIGLGFLGGVKILGLLVAAGLVLKILGHPKTFAILVRNFLKTTSLLVFLFILWSFISSFWAPNITWALARISTYIGLFLIMQAIGLLTRDQVRKMWIYLLLGAVLSVLLGFFLPKPTELIATSGRFTSGGNDPNDYANLLVIVIGVVFYGVFSGVKKRLSKIALFFVGIVVIGILLSLSRTALVNLLVVATIPPILQKSLKGTVRALAVAALALIGIVALFRDFTDMAVQRYSTLGQLTQEETWAGRVDIWRAALTVFAERPFTGIGTGNFAYVSPYYSYYAALIASTREDGSGAVAHNMFLSVMAETGVIGLFLFITLLFSAYASAWCVIRRGERLGYGLLAGLLAYSVAGLTLTWEYVKIPYILYGSLLALLNEEGKRA